MTDWIDPARRPVMGRNLTLSMVDSLGRAIVTGSFDGKRFPTEAELTAQHGVSRVVTREAVKMLTAKGLLSSRPRQGTTVEPSTSWNLFDTDILNWLLERKFSVGLLKHFTELRLSIEPMAALFAARSAGKAELAVIEAGYRRMELADLGEDDALDADIAFHVGIMRASGNPFFFQFESVVSTALRSSIRFTNRLKGHSASLPAHKAVLDAIASKDQEGARAAMFQIIADVLALIDARQPAGAGDMVTSSDLLA
jgi:DNA-binding FadR family transcriptional regulator